MHSHVPQGRTCALLGVFIHTVHSQEERGSSFYATFVAMGHW